MGRWPMVKQTLITPLPSHAQSVEDATKHPPLPLFLKAGHYVTLKPGLTPFPMSWHYSPANSKWDAGSARGGNSKWDAGSARGGVKSDKSYRSWLPPSTPAKSQRVTCDDDIASNADAKSYRSWLPPSSTASHNSDKKAQVAVAKSYRSWLPPSSASSSSQGPIRNKLPKIFGKRKSRSK